MILRKARTKSNRAYKTNSQKRPRSSMDDDDLMFDLGSGNVSNNDFITPENSVHGTPDGSRSSTPAPQRRRTTSETTPTTSAASSGRRKPRTTSESSSLGGKSFGAFLADSMDLDDVFVFDEDKVFTSSPTHRRSGRQGSKKSGKSKASERSEASTSSQQRSRTSSESSNLGQTFESDYLASCHFKKWGRENSTTSSEAARKGIKSSPWVMKGTL